MQAYRMLIDGEWVDAQSKGTFDVMNPATDEVMAKVPDGGAADGDRAAGAGGGGVTARRGASARRRSGDASSSASPRRCGTSCRGSPSSRPATPASPSSSP